MEKSDEEKQQQQQHRSPMSMPPTPSSDDPWLVFFHGERGKNQTFYNISEGLNHVRDIPCLRRKDVCTCSHGWMVLTGRSFDECYECFLLNPNTMEKIQLPPVDFRFEICVLSSSPVDLSCTVLFISSCPRDDVLTFRYCSPNKSGTVDCWRIKQEVKFEDVRIVDATSCGGKIYGLTNWSNQILIVEVVDTTTLMVRKMEVREVGIPFLLEGPLHRVLVESCSELYLVWLVYEEEYKPLEIQEFVVFRLDFSRMVWERVKSLGNRAFFLGHSSRCSLFVKESSESGIMGNMIYFTMEKDRSLYTYSLEENSIGVSLPCPKVQHNWSQPNWVLPEE